MYNSQLAADRIKKRLIDIKKTGKQMALECGLGINVMSNIRRGDVKSVETFYKIADYLDCSVDYLLGRTDVVAVNRGNEDEMFLVAARTRVGIDEITEPQAFTKKDLDKNADKLPNLTERTKPYDFGLDD